MLRLPKIPQFAAGKAYGPRIAPSGGRNCSVRSCRKLRPVEYAIGDLSQHGQRLAPSPRYHQPHRAIPAKITTLAS